MGKRKTNKQAPLTKEGTEKKEEKVKKTYALPKAEEKGHAGDSGGLEKVGLPERLEKEIVDLILQDHQNRTRLGVLSKRITRKKLTDVYNSLSNAGFSQRQVEGAMNATVSLGGDLHDALDWLCLNTPNDQLPRGFSHTLQAEEDKKKSKPSFDLSQQVDARDRPLEMMQPAAAPLKEIKSEALKDDVKDWIRRYVEESSESSGDEEEKDPNSQYLLLTAQLEDAKAQAADAKQRGNKPGHDKASRKVRELMQERAVLERHPAFNPATRLTAATSSTTNTRKKPTRYDPEMDEIEQIIEESEAASSKQSFSRPMSADAYGGFNDPSSLSSMRPTSGTGKKKASGGAKSKASKNGGDDDDDEGGFNLFGFDDMESAAAMSTSGSLGASGSQSKGEDVRQFEYTRQQWTGKHPKQFLIDWCRKHLPKSPPPKYHKIQVRHNRFKCRVSVERQKGDVLEVTPDILCETAKEAEMLGCTLAIYHLCRGQSVHQLLPPPYRAVWLEWLDMESAAKQEAKEKENKPRDQFLSRLMKKLKVEEGEASKMSTTGNGLSKTNKDDRNSAADSGANASSVTLTSCGDGGVKANDNDDDDGDGDSDDEVQDSWEALADDDDDNDEDEVSTKIVRPKSASSAQSFATKQSNRLPVSSESLQQALQRLQTGCQHKDLLAVRQQLPVFQFRQKVLQAVEESTVVVVAGETGSGKSTQVPQFLLEGCIMKGQGSKCNILVTQPRRISAISLANRVSQEIGESPKDGRNNLCGHQIRFESRKSASTRLLYCTTGVVLRQLQSDKDLSNVSHLIIDEVHERSVQSDFLLTVVKNILERRTDLKVILMSATLDSAKFSKYFTNCPVMNIPGRTFPVEVQHLEDVVEMTGYVVDEDSPYTLKHSQLVEEESATVEVTDRRGESSQMDLFWTKEDISHIDRTSLEANRYSKRTRNAVTRLDPSRINMDLMVDLLRHLNSAPPYRDIDGAVVVFLPGLADIHELYEILTTDRHFSNPNKFQIFALHSVLSSEDQGRVFTVPPKGVRKIVLATNIAETGITIPDAVFVIDSGKAKENRYNESSQMSSLTEVFISKANAKQRQGRAGRVREGFCFRFFTAEKFHKMADYTVPELLRVPLEELCLTIMKCEMGRPEDFLATCLDPPPASSVQRAMSLLREVGACFADTCALTSLGHHLAALPLNVRVGKMLVYGAILGCLEPVAVIAAAMTDKSPFVVPLSHREEANAAKLSLSTAASDHLTVYRAYVGWTQARSKGRSEETAFCSRFFLKRNTLLDIENVKNDLIKLICSIGFGATSSPTVRPRTVGAEVPDVLDISKMTSKTHDLDSHTVAMVKAVLCAGLYSQVARVTPVDTARASAHPGERKPCLTETAQGHSQVHPSSVNRHLMMHSLSWLVYGEKVKVSRVYIRDTTLVSAYPLLLFGGDIKVQHLQKLLVVDNWIKYMAVAKTGVVFKELRLLFDRLLERKLAEPALNIADDRLVKLITELLKSEKPVIKC